jgi:hypothetical protein
MTLLIVRVVGVAGNRRQTDRPVAISISLPTAIALKDSREH